MLDVKGGFNVANFNVLFAVALLLDMQCLDEHLIGRLKGFEATKKGEMRDYLKAEVEVRLQGLCRKNQCPKRSELFGAILGAVNNTVDAFRQQGLTASEKVKYLILGNIMSGDDSITSILSAYPPSAAWVAEEWELMRKHYPDSLLGAACNVHDLGIETSLKITVDGYKHPRWRAVAYMMPDGSWVGWPYWRGQGTPDINMDWISHAFSCECQKKEVKTVKYEFSLPERP